MLFTFTRGMWNMYLIETEHDRARYWTQFKIKDSQSDRHVECLITDEWLTAIPFDELAPRLIDKLLIGWYEKYRQSLYPMWKPGFDLPALVTAKDYVFDGVVISDCEG